MAEKKRKYEAEIQALANLTLQLRLMHEAEPTLEALPETSVTIAPLDVKIPHKKDVVLRLIKRIKNA